MADTPTVLPPGPSIYIGTVIDQVQTSRWYNVRTSIGSIPCSATVPFGGGPLEAKEIGMYAPNTLVLVYIPPSITTQAIVGQGGLPMQSEVLEPRGYILGSITGPTGTNEVRVVDSITPRSEAIAGFNDPMNQADATTLHKQYTDHNFGHPLDSVAGSDTGRLNEFGLGYGLSRFFAWLRASELAGIWCFYLDNLTRLAAYNYEFWHSGGERWIKDDEGEINDVDLFTPYPWEAMGMLDPLVSSLLTQANGGLQVNGQSHMYLEPATVQQLMVPRLIKLRGYLGDLQREMVVMPRITLTDYTDTLDANTFVEKYTRETKYTGVLDIQKHTSGLYIVRSAQGIIHEKTIYIPVPKQMHPPEDADTDSEGKAVGDGTTNYRPSGYWGAGNISTALHGKQAWAWTDPDRPETWAAELYDFNTYMFNWYGVKPLVAHANDWYLTEEGFFGGETGYDPAGEELAGPPGVYIPPAALATSYMFPKPQYAAISIDHRDGKTNYFYSRSIIAQLPDGSILIEDGYGSSVHMVGGNIVLTCAGDILQRPGRSAIVMAGDDAVIRAGSSVDITAANADVRIKAERNMHMLAGNNGIMGGILLESRAVFPAGGVFRFRDDEGNALVGEDVSTYGIMLKAPNGPVMVYGRDIYGRAISYQQQGGDDIGGNIELESDQATTMSAIEQIRYSKEALVDIIGQELSDGVTLLPSSIVNYYSIDDTIISSKNLFRVLSQYVALDTPNGNFVACGPLSITQGVQPIAAASAQAIIAGYSADYIAWTNGAVGDKTTLPGMLSYYYADIYSAAIKGDATFISVAGFTCRNGTQYGLATDFLIVEARWQQTYRKASLGIIWYEPTVSVPGLVTPQFTHPYPGYEIWVTNEQYMEYNSDLWQWKDDDDEWWLHARDRSDIVDDTVDIADQVRVYDQERIDRENGVQTAQVHTFFNSAYRVSKQYGQ